jgi:hypothetical protein
MGSNNIIQAPNEDELREIRQIEDRSAMTGIYFEPQKQYEGEVILSQEERSKAIEEKTAAASKGIWKSFLRIGLFIPYPLVIGASIAAALYTFAKELNPLLFLGICILSLGVWGVTSYFAYSAIFKVFYKHGLRAGPFLLVMLISVLLASQAAYGLVAVMFVGAELPLLFNTTLISIVLLIYSIIMSGILLAVWGNPKLKSLAKAIASVLVVITSGLFVLFVYLM